jgi:DNA-directed RNA polymerase beta' subunit
MQIHRARIDHIIKLNGLKEVKDLNMLDKGMPTPEGLFSYDIFGWSQHDRRSIPAYIDLKGKFLHPLVYSNLKAINRKFEFLVSGTKYFRVNEAGALVEDPSGETGLDFLYRVWDQIKYKDTQSIFGSERVKNITNQEYPVWIDKWLLLPAFYRDLNFNQEGRPSYDEINEKYINIIRKVNSISQQEQYGFVSNLAKAQVQLIINQIHDEIVDAHVRAKHGTLKRSVMSKSVTDGARLVISAPNIKGERFNDVQVRYNQMGVPLAAVCSIFHPFVVYGVREFFQQEFVTSGKYGYWDVESKSVKYTRLINPEAHYSDEYIIKMIKKFIYGTSTRYETIDVPPNEDGLKLKVHMEGRFGDSSSVTRFMTWTDVLYQVCEDILSERHIYATRYPIEDHFGIVPSKMAILTTKDTTPAIIGDKTYKFYPVVNPDQPSDRDFIDTLNLPLAYLTGYGADFDGDMMSIIGVYTDEANADAQRHTMDKKNILTNTSENIRVAQRDFVQTYYALTKRPNMDDAPKFNNLSRVANF